MAVALFDTEKFISHIKKHPAIYDVNCLQYIDRAAKTNAWYEVCRAMTPDWNSLTDEERAIEDKCLRNKWRNIRDYFMKEVKAQKKPGSRGGRKRKKSTYYDHLLFLIPSVKKRGKGKNSRLQQLKNELLLRDDIEIVATPEVEEYNLLGGPLDSRDQTDQDASYQHHRQTVAACETSITSYENEMSVDVLNAVGGGGSSGTGGAGGGQTNRRSLPLEDDDYDRMFLLSLLPSLRLIPEHMKLHVRIQMQQILVSAFHTNNHGASP